MISNPQLLIEYLPISISPQQLNESIARNNGKVFLEGVIQRADTINGNKRKYPFEVLAQEVERYIKECVNTNTSSGELDHSEKEVIELKNASHIIRKLWWVGNDLWGRIELLSTPSGNIARKILESDMALGISSRALGSVEELNEGVVEVQEDLRIICWDLVSTPSTQGAFLKQLNESQNLSKSNTKYSKIEEIITDILCSNTLI